METKNIFVYLSTLGPVGYLPAPGTMATLVTLPLIYFLSFLDLSPVLWLIFSCCAVIFSLKIIGRALEQFKLRDPSEIVLDEVVGCLVVFYAVPITFVSLGIGFILFRFFDILKPLGIGKCELLYGSLGVVMDDVLAGVFANIVLRVFFYYF